MKRSYRLLAVVATILLATAPLNAAAQTVASKITAVTVYNDRALVTKTAQVSLAAGTNALVFEDLSMTVDQATLRAQVDSPHANVMGLVQEVVSFRAEDAAAVNRLQDEARRLRDQTRAALSDRIVVLERQKLMLETMAQSSAALSGDVVKTGFDARNWETAYDFIGGRLTAVVDSIRALTLSRDEIDSKINKLQAEADSMQRVIREKARKVTVEIVANSATRCEVKLDYVITGARWTPIYHARMVDSGRVLLSYFGQVQQNTGEDWDNVELTLSTAQPNRSASPGELVPRLLSVRDLTSPQSVVELLTSQTGTAERFGGVHIRGGRSNEVMYVIDGVAVMDPIGGIAVDQAMNISGDVIEDLMIIKGGFDAEYGNSNMNHVAVVPMLASGYSSQFRVQGRQSIASGALTVRTPITDWTLQGETRLVARPKNRLGVYRYVALKNETGTQLLPGQISLFAASDYVGSLNSPFYLLPGQEFELAFGIDDRVAISREIINRRISFDGDNRKLKETATIALINNGQDSVVVDLEEALPVSSDNRVKVRLSDISPETDGDVFQGIHRWRIALPPGAKQEVRATYEVEHPSSISLVGM